MQKLFYHKLFIIFTLSLFLSACGFRLAGSEPLPFQNLAVKSNNPYGRLSLQLERELKNSGIQLADNAPYRLEIEDLGLTYNSGDYGPSNQARIYNFIYQVRVSLLNKQMKTLEGPQLFSATRKFTYNANQLVENNDESQLLSADMQRELVNQIFHYLAAPDTQKALQEKKKGNKK